MKSQESISLKSYNTFGIDVKAPQLIEVTSKEQLKQLLSTKKDYFILGGGSNMLLTKDIEIPILHIALKGIEVYKKEDTHIWVEVQAGENWHQFVEYALDKGWGGIENLSLIPGNVGTTPIQNIGAYGVEIKDIMHSCKAIEIESLKEKEFSCSDCQFGYRESIFKAEAKGKYIITSVIYKLTKKNHSLHIDYGTIKNQLKQMDIKNPTPKDISNAVITIRQSKLPDPRKIGNSGSFFKNPILEKSHFEKIRQKYPNIPFYDLGNEKIKIPAGWLIETCGLKGYRKKDAGVHQKQALVLVNYGNAQGKDIWQLAQFVQKTVEKEFGIPLEYEVNIF